MTKILVAAAAYNFAETYRMKTIGKVFKQLGYDVYSMGVGRYSYMLNEGMKYLTTDSDSMWYTGERINRMMNMDLYGNDYCSYEELKKIVYDEIEILREIKPDIVITGYRTTLSLSCRALKIPLVWILSATVSRVYFEKGFATIPERYEENFFQNIKDVNIKNKYYCRLTLKNSSTSKVWNNIARELGVSSFKSDIDIFSGDLNLLSDCPELFPEFRDLENKYQFCGPIFCKNEIGIPDYLKGYRNEKRKKVFLTMGSSGEKEIILKILDFLMDEPIDVFVSCTSVIEEHDIKKYGGRYFFSEFFPHEYMGKFVDASIIHGGQGTVYTSLLCGKPFIGIGMFSEQQYNLENIEKHGNMIKISIKKLTKDYFLDALWRLLNESQFLINAEKMQKVIAPYYINPIMDASYVAVEKIRKFFNV